MTQLIKKVLIGLPLLAMAQAHAGLLSGFEQGLDGWSYIGDVSTQSGDIGLAPSQGRKMAFLSTMCDSVTSPTPCATIKREHPYSGVSSPNSGVARAFLGLPAGGEDFSAAMPQRGHANVGESGAMSFRFYAAQAGSVSFDWNKLGPDADSAYFTVWSGDNTWRTSDWLYDYMTIQTAYGPSGVNLCSRYYDNDPSEICSSPWDRFNVETGWQSRSVDLGQAGWYTIGFGMGEIEEGTVPSVLALDNVRFAASVPEPGTYALMALGLGIIVLLSKRRPDCR